MRNFKLYMIRQADKQDISRIAGITDFYVEPFFVGQGIGTLFHGFVNSGKTCIIEGTVKEDCCYEYILK